MTKINTKKTEKTKPFIIKTLSFLITTLTGQTSCQMAGSPFINHTNTTYRSIEKISGASPQIFTDGHKNLFGVVANSKEEIYSETPTSGKFIKEKPRFLKEIISSVCDKNTYRCIFGGIGGAEVYNIKSTGIEFIGYFWASNQSTYFGDPVNLIMVNSVESIEFTEYFLSAESTDTGIMRFASSKNTSYSFMNIALEDEKITSINFMIHIPRTPFFVNSFRTDPHLSVSDFTSMNNLGKWKKAVSFNSNFHLAFYDKDPSKGYILASRYSVVQIHDYNDKKYIREIPVKSPTYKSIVIPESDFFFVVTSDLTILYNITNAYTSDFLWETQNGVRALFWDDFSNEIVYMNTTEQLVGIKHFFTNKEKPDPAPFGWYDVTEHYFCNPNCEECDFLFGRAGCKSGKCVSVGAIYINNGAGTLIVDPPASKTEFTSLLFTNANVPVDLKAKGCYSTPYRSPPASLTNFHQSPTLTLTAPEIELKKNETEPTAEPVPSNQIIYTKNSTIPLPTDKEETGKSHWGELLIILLILLIVTGLLIYLICFLFVESPGNLEKRKKMNIWRLKGWIKNLRLKYSKKSSSENDSLDIKRKSKMKKSMDQFMIDNQLANEKIKDIEVFKFSEEIPGENLKRRQDTKKTNVIGSNTPKPKKFRTLGEDEEDREREDFSFGGLTLKKKKSHNPKKVTFGFEDDSFTGMNNDHSIMDESLDSRLEHRLMRPKSKSFNQSKNSVISSEKNKTSGFLRDKEFVQIPMKNEKRKEKSKSRSKEKKKETKEERRERRRKARIERRKRLKEKAKREMDR